MKKIKRVTPSSLAKVLGFLYAVVGLIGGLIFLIVSLFSIASGGHEGWFGLLAVIGLPILYGVMGLVLGYIIAWIYNLAAKKTGGIELEFD